MKCEYLGLCGGCVQIDSIESIYNFKCAKVSKKTNNLNEKANNDFHLENKLKNITPLFADIFTRDKIRAEIFQSPKNSGFRAVAELGIFHKSDKSISYSMRAKNSKKQILIKKCILIDFELQEALSELLEILNREEFLDFRSKLFSIEAQISADFTQCATSQNSADFTQCTANKNDKNDKNLIESKKRSALFSLIYRRNIAANAANSIDSIKSDLKQAISNKERKQAAGEVPHEEEAFPLRFATLETSRDALVLHRCSAVGTGAATAFTQCGTNQSGKDRFKEKTNSKQAANTAFTEAIIESKKSSWEQSAEKIKNELESKTALKVGLIGKSKGAKIIIGADFLEESLPILGQEITYKYNEGAFRQSNFLINQKMIEWVMERTSKILNLDSMNLDAIKKDSMDLDSINSDSIKMLKNQTSGDLLELYCGAGNFTLALSRIFQKVLASEVNKNAIKATKWAQERNKINNLWLLRMDARDVMGAVLGEREYFRLKEQNIKITPPKRDSHLKGIESNALNQASPSLIHCEKISDSIESSAKNELNFNFKAIFLDPPRAGLGPQIAQFASNFQIIIYISCNPHTMAKDLEIISKSHKIAHFAYFDQFPHSEHIECGAILIANNNN